jgi:MoaA/NifB/PqqE/SkfB family radical SAM enzyme
MEKEFKKIRKQLPTASWCPQVFTGLSIQSDGMAPCCEWKGSKIHANTIDEYKTDPLFVKLLQDVENGEWNPGCSNCMLREKNGQVSQRLREVKNQLRSYGNYDTSNITTEPFDELYSKDQYLWMNLQPTNKCNQACVMCWAGSSSKLEEEVKQNPNTHWLDYHPRFHHYNDWTVLAANRHPKGRLYLSGGEPSVMKDVINYLDAIPNPEDVQVDMNSNFNSFNNKFWDILERFGTLNILASIDAVDKRSEYIRYLSKWNEVEQNLLKTKEKLPNASVKINPTWTMLNIWYANELADWCKKYEFDVYLNNISYTQTFAPMYLHDDYKTIVQETFLNTHWKDTNQKEILEIVDAIGNAKFDKQKFELFKNYISKIDNVRKTNTFEIFPKVKKYIEDIDSKEY